MKQNVLKSFLFFGLLILLATACKDRDAEKKIAQLESRLAELEGKKSPDATATNAIPTAPETKPEGPLPKMEFEVIDHDFGTINEGDIVEHTYAFKNTGDAPLIIQGAQGSCGCTVPVYPKEPVLKGQEAVIKVTFNSAGKLGVQDKTVTITSNAKQNPMVLHIKGNVEKPEGVSEVKEKNN